MNLFKVIGYSIIFSLTALQAVSKYAENCERVIGVPIPDIDCSDPKGSSVPVGKIEKGQCDTPSHGLSNCNPGTRFIKYTDIFIRDGKEEEVTTLIMCRKTNEDLLRKDEGKDIYSDIGIIQYNETKHATCWFSKTTDGQKPTKNVNGKKVYPSPSTETKPTFWGDQQPDTKCLQCHQAGVWLRSPFAMGVEPEKGKGYIRIKSTGDYKAGSGNHIPENNAEVARRGLSCSVGKPDWNKADGTNVPRQIKIDADSFNRKFPEKSTITDSVASGNCTSCHYIGVGANNLFCDTFLNELMGKSNKLRREAVPFSKHFWMPPDTEFNSKQDYLNKYGGSFEAVKWCCNQNNEKDLDYKTICTTNKFTRGGEEGKILNALNSRGPCALCPDCGSKLDNRKNIKTHDQ